MFKEIASALKLNYKEIVGAHQNKFYKLYNERIIFEFSIIIDPRSGNIEIISRGFSLGKYKKEELDKAKKEIIVKIQEEMS